MSKTNSPFQVISADYPGPGCSDPVPIWAPEQEPPGLWPLLTALQSLTKLLSISVFRTGHNSHWSVAPWAVGRGSRQCLMKAKHPLGQAADVEMCFLLLVSRATWPSVSWHIAQPIGGSPKHLRTLFIFNMAQPDPCYPWTRPQNNCSSLTKTHVMRPVSH